jgi:hypothetical protein
LAALIAPSLTPCPHRVAPVEVKFRREVDLLPRLAFPSPLKLVGAFDSLFSGSCRDPT